MIRILRMFKDAHRPVFVKANLFLVLFFPVLGVMAHWVQRVTQPYRQSAWWPSGSWRRVSAVLFCMQKIR